MVFGPVYHLLTHWGVKLWVLELQDLLNQDLWGVAQQFKYTSSLLPFMYTKV